MKKSLFSLVAILLIACVGLFTSCGNIETFSYIYDVEGTIQTDSDTKASVKGIATITQAFGLNESLGPDVLGYIVATDNNYKTNNIDIQVCITGDFTVDSSTKQDSETLYLYDISGKYYIEDDGTRKFVDISSSLKGKPGDKKFTFNGPYYQCTEGESVETLNANLTFTLK